MEGSWGTGGAGPGADTMLMFSPSSSPGASTSKLKMSNESQTDTPHSEEDLRVIWTANTRNKEGLEADGAPEDIEVHQEDGAALDVHAPAHSPLRRGAGRGCLHLPRPASLLSGEPALGPLVSPPDDSPDSVEAVADKPQAVGELGGHREEPVGHVGAQDILTFISKIKVNRWEIISIHWTMLESA